MWRSRIACCGAVLVLVIAAGPASACREPSHVVEGVASYYDESFDGEQTASEETHSSRSYTAAHRTLPFGTRVRVTNLANGRSVWVRINDRGPFVEDRVIDLSRAAAKKLRMTDRGLTRVKLEIYEEETR